MRARDAQSAAYENYAWTDGDPDGKWTTGLPFVESDSSFDWGYSGKIWVGHPDKNRSAIFLETIRDAGRANAKTEALIVTHEIGHTAGTGIGHTPGGADGDPLAGRRDSIMNESPNSASDTLFDNTTQSFLRWVEVW